MTDAKDSEREIAREVLAKALFKSEERADPRDGPWETADEAARDWYRNRIADLLCEPLELFERAKRP
jgi:hypothetical protein